MSELKSTIQNKALENFVDDIYSFLKGKAKIAIKSWDTKRKMHALYLQLNKVRLVKTLWQVDKAVDLISFYCDSHLIVDKKRIKITKLLDIPKKGNLLIEGIAGQGKSIFLRYLCSKTLSEGQIVPVFVELRKIQKNESLVQHILGFLDILKIKADNEIFDHFANTGNIVLFLDGFDELAEEIKLGIIREIEYLANIYDNLRIIVTSRPNGGLEMSPSFEVIKLDNLIGSEYKKVIVKLSDNIKFADNLIKQIETNKANLKELLFTPLLVTLLIMSYKSYQELPEQLSDFYDSIFQVLLQRHDGAKPGYKRPRKCKLNDSQYRSLFENLCFNSKKMFKSIFSYKEIYDITQKTIADNNMNIDAEEYLTDIFNVTCLLLREGNECRFIHKSVQEYYSAAFISNKPDKIALQFYNNCYYGQSGFRWEQELRFLKEIDTYRFYKYYLIPSLYKLLMVNEEQIPNQAPTASLEMILHLYGSIDIGYSLGPDNKMHIRMIHIKNRFLDYDTFNVWSIGGGVITELVENKKVKYRIEKENLLPLKENGMKENLYIVELGEVIKNNNLSHLFVHDTTKFLNDKFSLLLEAKKYVDVNDSYNLDMETKTN